MTLPPRAFAKADPTSDTNFYSFPRFVTHIDENAVMAVTGLYREILRPGDEVLDLMSSWVSHLPPDVELKRVVGHGLNEAELQKNPALQDHFVQNLNENQTFPLETASFDAILCCVSVQYLQHPVEVWREAARVVRPGGRAAITFSNRMFPTKAIALWQALEMPQRGTLVANYLEEAGWTNIEIEDRSPRHSDPLLAVTATRP